MIFLSPTSALLWLFGFVFLFRELAIPGSAARLRKDARPHIAKENVNQERKKKKKKHHHHHHRRKAKKHAAPHPLQAQPPPQVWQTQQPPGPPAPTWHLDGPSQQQYSAQPQQAEFPTQPAAYGHPTEQQPQYPQPQQPYQQQPQYPQPQQPYQQQPQYSQPQQPYQQEPSFVENPQAAWPPPAAGGSENPLLTAQRDRAMEQHMLASPPPPPLPAPVVETPSFGERKKPKKNRSESEEEDDEDVDEDGARRRRRPATPRRWEGDPRSHPRWGLGQMAAYYGDEGLQRKLMGPFAGDMMGSGSGIEVYGDLSNIDVEELKKLLDPPNDKSTNLPEV